MSNGITTIEHEDYCRYMHEAVLHFWLAIKLTKKKKIETSQDRPAKLRPQRRSSVAIWVFLDCAVISTLVVSLMAYRTDWGQEHLNDNILISLAGFSLVCTLILARLVVFWTHQATLLKNIRANLESFTHNNTETHKLLQTLKPLPIRTKPDSLVKGWNNLINAIDQASDKSRVETSEKNLDQVFGSYESQRLSKLFDALTNGIILADITGSVVLVNRTGEGMLGRSLSQMVGHSILTLFTDPQARSAFQKLLDKQTPENTQTFELSSETGLACVQKKTKTSDNEKEPNSRPETACENQKSVFRISCQRINAIDPSSDILIVIRDMTQQKISESSQSDFVAHVSHELRSPLANIRAYAETLLSDMVLDANTQKEAFNVINDETVRLTRMINDVLDLSQMEAGSMRLEKSEVVTDRLIRQCLNDLKAMAASKNITLQTNFHPKIQNLYADRDKLAIVINNVLSNAIKYTPESGTVFFETNQDEEFVYIKMTDTGYGIPPEDIDKIFDKFYRVDRKETADITGSGLGLSTSKEIITQHGGAIDVTSELSKGTEMTIKLPLTTIGPVIGPAVTK